MGLMMGYLKKPITDKISHDVTNESVRCGASSMQGWRTTQEDAHNCILDFDKNGSFFAVYDGHGGKEVAIYTSENLPELVKNLESYKNGDYEDALKEAFLKFDATLKEDHVIEVLKELSKGEKLENESESEDENLGNLKEEAQMSIEEVMAKYMAKKANAEAAKADDEKSVSSHLSNNRTVDSSEVSSNVDESGSSSSKCWNVNKNEADFEVSSSSSSSSGNIIRKTLSEKYSNGECNGGESNNSSVIDVPPQSESSENSKQNTIDEKPLEFPDSSDDVSKTDSNSTSAINGSDGDAQREEDAISSSVENGEIKSSKGKGKGKAPLKKQPKATNKKSTESPEKLFEKFVHSEAAEDSSGSDSDDVTFFGPDSTSEDEDDVCNAEGEAANEEEEEEEADEEEDEDDEDESEDEDEDDDDEFTMKMSDKLKEYLSSGCRDKTLLDEKTPVGDEKDDDCCHDSRQFGKDFLINVLKSKVPGSDSGCTAVVALVKDGKIYVANAGDSRCIVSKKGELVEMSVDHKPEDKAERTRIVKAGGEVCFDGRVNGGLNLSRALGDHSYKKNADLPPEEQMISPLPDVRVLEINRDVEFMVLACDGIWNSMSSKEVLEFVRPRLEAGVERISKVCEELFEHCLAPDTLGDGTGCDNMTAVIVQFKNLSWSSSKKRSIEESEETDEGEKRLKTEDVTSTVSGKPSKEENPPDTTQTQTQ